MEEIEVPMEHLDETIKEKTEEALNEPIGKWMMLVAISTALVAVFAAIAGLMAGHHSDEAMIEQIKASDQWAFYQAKGIKAEIKSLQVNGINNDSAMQRYKKEQGQIKEQAEGHEKLSESHLSSHAVLARSVTLFQIAIAISAIAILTRKKILWYLGLLFSVAGIWFFLTGIL